MGPIIEVTDPADERLRDYVALRDASLRRSLEAERGLFIAEGDLIIRRACQAGYTPRSFLLAPRWIDGLRDVLEDTEAPVYLVSEALAERVSGFHVHRGALAAIRRRAGVDLADLLEARRLVVCEDTVDHTNVGAIIRCAAGLGWDGVLLSPGAADPLYRRAVKTSMGAVFALPWARLSSGVEDLRRLKRRGFTLAAFAPREDAVTLEAFAAEVAARPRPVALLLGTEGPGLSSAWLDAADLVVRIPMAHGIDSLNVATAAAIACYALREAPQPD